MNEKDMVYAAGLIDGDGSLSLTKKLEKDAKSPLYYPIIQFSQCKGILPEYLKSKFGGSLLVIKRETKNKPEHKWKLEKSNQCKPFLEKIVPYLQIKSEQGYELLKFIDENVFKRGKLLTDEQLINREIVYKKIKQLNARRDISSRLKVTSIKNKIDNELVWPYLAGLFDTDGSFSIKKEKTGRYNPCILLSLINSNAINFIERNCKYGTFFIVKAPQLKQKFYYRFGIYNKKEVIEFLKLIMPFLRYKKEAADILLKFCEGFIAQCGRYLKTQEQNDFREKCYQELIYLNKYGVYKSPLMDLKLLPGNAEDNKAEGNIATVNVASVETSKEDAVL